MIATRRLDASVTVVVTIRRGSETTTSAPLVLADQEPVVDVEERLGDAVTRRSSSEQSLDRLRFKVAQGVARMIRELIDRDACAAARARALARLHGASNERLARRNAALAVGLYGAPVSPATAWKPSLLAMIYEASGPACPSDPPGT